MEPIRNIYVYKMTTDSGGAPCVWRGTLSLAICKPMIRKMAEEGDLIIGFGGKDLDERLIYAAVVTCKPKRGFYYEDDGFSRRPDCIYHRDGDGFAQRRINAEYHKHSDQRPRDVGSRFERAHVLLSRDFRYFGGNGTIDYAAQFPLVANLVRTVGRGHRVNYAPSVHAELLKLKDRLWSSFPEMKNGDPTHGDKSRLCNTSTSCAKVLPSPPEAQ